MFTRFPSDLSNALNCIPTITGSASPRNLGAATSASTQTASDRHGRRPSGTCFFLMPHAINACYGTSQDVAAAYQDHICNYSICIIMYPIEPSTVNLREENYTQNEKSWAPVLERFENALRDVCSEGSEASLSRHQSRGQLLRECNLCTLMHKKNS